MLVNSDGNFLIVTAVNTDNVVGTVWRNKTEYTNGSNPFFQHTTGANFNCHPDLSEETFSKKGGGKPSIGGDLIALAVETISEQAIVDPERHRMARHIGPTPEDVIYIKGDWTVSV